MKSGQNCEGLKLCGQIDRWDGWTDVYISDFKYHESRTVLIKTPVKGSSYAGFQHLRMQLNSCEYFRISFQGETVAVCCRRSDPIHLVLLSDHLLSRQKSDADNVLV